MQTHDNINHSSFMEVLRKRAEKATEARSATITAGHPDEKELGSWRGSNGVYCSHMPDDEQGILRISIGGGDHLPVTMNYLTIRGKVGQCIELLEKALVALRECPE